jgi:cytoskeletal protein CcmA (bactofilin family)
MAKNTVTESPAINILGTGTMLKGDIQSNGDFRIDGTLVGSIQCKGIVVIGTTGKIEGEIFCKNVDISGSVSGQMAVEELTSLKSTSKVKGDIATNQLAIEPGAKFSGNCNMDGSGLKDNMPKTKDEDAKEKAV